MLVLFIVLFYELLALSTPFLLGFTYDMFMALGGAFFICVLPEEFWKFS